MIPKIFYQSWDDELPDHIKKINNLNIPNNFIYKRYSLPQIRKYIKNHHNDEYLLLFDSYKKIAHKIDLWRYLILYEKGGIYMDADCILLNKIDELLNNDFIVVHNNKGVKNIFNGFIATVPKNPIIKEIINQMLIIKNSFKNYYFNCKIYYDVLTKYINIDYKNNFFYSTNLDLNICVIYDIYIKNYEIQKDWIEFHKHYGFLNNKILFVENNKYYPYS